MISFSRSLRLTVKLLLFELGNPSTVFINLITPHLIHFSSIKKHEKNRRCHVQHLFCISVHSAFHYRSCFSWSLYRHHSLAGVFIAPLSILCIASMTLLSGFLRARLYFVLPASPYWVVCGFCTYTLYRYHDL